MSKKKLEEFEKRIANLEKTPVRDMKAYCVGLSEYNSILDLKRVKKEYEAQMEKLRKIVCSEPIKPKENTVSANVKGSIAKEEKSPVFINFKSGDLVFKIRSCELNRAMSKNRVQEMVDNPTYFNDIEFEIFSTNKTASDISDSFKNATISAQEVTIESLKIKNKILQDCVDAHEVVSGEKVIYNEIHSEEVVEKLREENKKLREENESLKETVERHEGSIKNSFKQKDKDDAQYEDLMSEYNNLNGKFCNLKSSFEAVYSSAYNQAIDDAANTVMSTTLMSVALDRKFKKLKKK